MYAKYYNSMRNLKTSGFVIKTSRLHKSKDIVTGLKKYGWTQRAFGKKYIISEYTFK